MNPLHPARPSRGFTLIEVMITVAIVAILAAVALPAYTDYVRRGQLSEAFATLSDYRVKMEQYYQDHRNYGGAACADGAPTPAWASFSPASLKHFELSCTVSGGGQRYTLTARGKTGVAATGHEYTVDQDNTQRTVTFKGASSSATCWLIKGSEC